MQYVFLDSNLFLQCRPLEDLDWGRIAGNEDATLLVPSAVLAELDKHKADGNSRRAQRARRAIKFLDSLLEAPDDTLTIRKAPIKVIAQFAPEVSGEVSSSNDDSILFEVEEMARKLGNSAVSLITHDTNLKVKAKRKNLRFFSVPDEWLLPPEPDDREKRLKRMEEEIALLKKQTPNMAIALSKDNEIEIVVPNYEPLAPSTIDRLIEAMTSKFPEKTDFSPSSREQFLSTERLGKFRLRMPTTEEVAKYHQEEYPEWKRRLREALERLHLKLRFRDSTADVSLLVTNRGAVPGEHVHIAIRVGNGLLNITPKYFDEQVKRLFVVPRAPNPPEPPESNFLDRIGTMDEIRSYRTPYMPETPIHRERDEFYLKAGENADTEWVWACATMRHGIQPQEFSFKVCTNVESQPTGGQLTVEVSAENLPQAAIETFRIRILNAPANTERAAKEGLGLNAS